MFSLHFSATGRSRLRTNLSTAPPAWRYPRPCRTVTTAPAGTGPVRATRPVPGQRTNTLSAAGASPIPKMSGESADCERYDEPVAAKTPLHPPIHVDGNERAQRVAIGRKPLQADADPGCPLQIIAKQPWPTPVDCHQQVEIAITVDVSRGNAAPHERLPEVGPHRVRWRR